MILSWVSALPITQLQHQLVKLVRENILILFATIFSLLLLFFFMKTFYTVEGEDDA